MTLSKGSHQSLILIILEPIAYLQLMSPENTLLEQTMPSRQLFAIIANDITERYSSSAQSVIRRNAPTPMFTANMLICIKHAQLQCKQLTIKTSRLHGHHVSRRSDHLIGSLLFQQAPNDRIC